MFDTGGTDWQGSTEGSEDGGSCTFVHAEEDSGLGEVIGVIG